MSTFFQLDFYIAKEPLDRVKVKGLIDVMAGHSFRRGEPFPHVPSVSVPGIKDEEILDMRTQQLYDAIVEAGEGRITFGGPPGYMTLWLRPMGRVGPKSPEGGNADTPLGKITLNWQRVYDEDYIRAMFAATIEIGKSLYAYLTPVYGFSYLEDLSMDRDYNLIPTEENIFEHGPRDFFPINFWSPSIAERIEWQQLEDLPFVNIQELEDGGVLAYIEPEHYAVEPAGGCPHWVDAEIVLGWRGDLDVETYRSLIQYVERQKREDPEALARRLGLSEEAIGGGSEVVERAGLSPGDFLNRILLGWREYALEIARRVRAGEVEVDPDDEEHLEDVFEAFVERIGRR